MIILFHNSSYSRRSSSYNDDSRFKRRNFNTPFSTVCKYFRRVENIQQTHLKHIAMYVSLFIYKKNVHIRITQVKGIYFIYKISILTTTL